MPKRKLKRFAEIRTFGNVIEPHLTDILNKDHFLKGHWKESIFKNDNPVVLELGCGKGEYTVGLAEKYPQKNFIGIDIKGARLWGGAKSALEKKLANVKFLRTRIEFIDAFFGSGEVDEIWITFPDPQPQKPRERKRLTSFRFLNQYKKFLRKDGMIHLKTDNEGLYKYTLDVIKENKLRIIESCNDLYNSADCNQEAKAFRTHYESIFLEKGMKIHYLKFML